MKRLCILFSFLLSFSIFANSVVIFEDISMISKEKRKEFYLDIYPTAKEGMKQYLVFLEKKEKEENFKVELRFGKEKMVDDCNLHAFLSGQLEKKVVASWGYPYYEFSGTDKMMQTMMYCGEKKIKKMVYYPIENGMLQYSSKLPFVIYTPKDVKLEVHIWQHQEEKSSR